MLIEQLFQNLALTAEVFATCEVSRGWRLRLDGLEWVTLHFVLEGEGELRTRGRPPVVLSPYTLAIVPPRLDHELDGAPPTTHEQVADDGADHEGQLLRFTAGPGGDRELLVACARVQATFGGGLGLFDLLRDVIVLDFSDSEAMRRVFGRLLEEQREASFGTRTMTEALMNECLVLVFRRLCSAPECPLPWLTALEDPRLASALGDVLDHPERDHSVESLAESARMSRSAFAEGFTEHFGRTPMAFVRDVRLRRAADLLLHSELPVEAVGRRVGYASRSHFSRLFTGYFGASPAAFRREAASVPARTQ